jgi:hypothetical protein
MNGGQMTKTSIDKAAGMISSTVSQKAKNRPITLKKSPTLDPLELRHLKYARHHNDRNRDRDQYQQDQKIFVSRGKDASLAT